MERPLLKLHSHGRNLKKWSIAEANERSLMRVRSSGLFSLSHIISSYYNKVLLSAFVEKWHPETNSFHFRFGEMTITLDDVPHLVGLQVEGLAMHAVDKTREECLAMVQRCLGATADVAENKVTTNNRVEFEWLMKTFSEVVHGDSEERVDCCARAYLLYLLGSTLFADKTGTTVSVQFLTLLEDLGWVRDYAWGVRGLGHLYRQLGQASRRNCKQLSGYMSFLEAWIREHFPMFRHARDPAYTEDLPLAARWLSRWETTMETTYHYRGMLDDLRPSQVVFDPYTDRRQVVADVVFYTGCIRAVVVFEPYLPDRVLRQFGLVQLVPGPPLVPLRGSRGANSHSYSVVYAYMVKLARSCHECRETSCDSAWSPMGVTPRLPSLVFDGLPLQGLTSSRRGAIYRECGRAQCSGFGHFGQCFGWD
ncbi:protein MAIN-LIKE 1-like [Rhododendron vialii]|uniref:protein MAIN-LIKE 1-like n=1 Tax=Rhododendron vialii TaxID=182163 RepID=UPI00265D99CE|nr:protein MAIN-LIKE 1-like [Rhododendron vialii]